ncbi:MAG: ribose 5-phosphate isomerase B [Candidatus Wallbacteria bacterium HGW-Wallbacteria-1]|jgi:ribose 5-phosphate isomerase B|uniref:Ribose 5-phosphate isomerase B n=1 Tax=Candidatus Wallbacteria bacterium HGW-Wallbacteria-1 TaxID=2013854 RepID=A0A2N1PSN0_9BACT|nr:MAG: ribose 5-phosphate isomerase B [Candidatus Wallbacteria bacterium HGW-Wallbacteria-1]
MKKPVIAFASDHGARELREKLVLALRDICEPMDLGTFDDASVDYPDYATLAVDKIRSNAASGGIILCGTGIGISIAANKYCGIRAALCHDEFTAEMARCHNDSNVLVLGGRVLGSELAERVARKWLVTSYEGGRHQNRLDKISAIERSEYGKK